jgi:hypothetical protein
MSNEEELIKDWEDQIDKRNFVQKKFPLKLIDRMENLDMDFKDPSVNQPKKKKVNRSTEILDLSKNKNKSKNKKLF